MGGGLIYEGVRMGEKRRRMPAHTDPGTPERLKQAHGRWDWEGDETPHIRFLAPCTLDWYFERHYIDDTQWSSGLRFRKDWLISGLMFRTTGAYAEYTDNSTDGAAGPNTRLDAADRVKRALMEIPLNCIGTVVAICGADEFGGRGCTVPLIVGLDALTEHYERRR